MKNRKYTLIILLSLTLFFGLFSYVSAQGNLDPFGGTKVNLENQLGLGNEDPRIVIANIIRIALGFLGIIAVGLVLYAGFLWMTAAGAADKIERAKKILIGAVIGLIIILASFGIATFILNSMMGATGTGTGGGGGGGGGGGCTPGATGSCGCGGTRTCVSGSWGPCVGSTCPPTTTSCDDNGDVTDLCGLPLACATDQFCDTATCLCENRGGLGADCNATTTPLVCDPSDARCDSLLRCDSVGPPPCTCQGAPVIDWLSPGAGTQDNFVTIGGRYFGTTAGQVYFYSETTGSTTVLAQFPNTVNAACTNNWQMEQIIVVVPTGATTGPIRVVRDDTLEDTTDNGRGEIFDFVYDGIVRPGICLASPASGQFNDNFTLQGANFTGASQRVQFGNETASTTANISTPWTGSSVGAAVPNIRAGRNTVFVDVDNRASNGLNFQVSIDPDNTPIIEYIDPPQGPAKQYITIYGRNFKTYLDSTSLVEFTSGATTVEADSSFPEQCRNNWWHDQYILVKVPTDAVPVGPWQITVTNRNAIESAPADFRITIGSAGPGLCLLDPHNGPVNTSVAAVGERFGATQGAGRTEFFDEQNGLVSAWSNLEISNNVPVSAETGPFFVSDGTAESNSLPFKVGKCAATTECESGEECCAGGTYDGICRATGSCGEGIAPSCTFGWTFTTAPGGTTQPTCRGYSGNTAQCLASTNCPNSPGQCQSESGAVLNRCDNAYCNDTFSICAGACVYDPALDKCKSVSATCDLADTTLLAGYAAQCRRVGDAGFWQISSPGSCPPAGATTTFRDTGDWCYLGLPGSPSGCDLCSSGFTCQAGECVINRDICPTGSDCTAGECVKTNSTCECCCRLANSAQDCCLGLTCAPLGCGASGDGCDPASDPTCTYGQCTGCRVELDSDRATYSPEEEAASDQACNCTGGSPTRYCSVDPTDLSDPANNGVCDDVALFGEDCYDAATAATCDPSDPPCDPLLYCNPAAGCTCTDPTGLPCDGDPLAPGCQDIGICGSDTCNTSTCICEETTDGGEPGARCVPPAPLAACTAGVTDCGSNYDCLSEASADCRCCCIPGDTIDVVSSSGAASTLTCIANKTPCDSTDDSRGLYCGCSEDMQCGDPDFVGCGLDTCCYERPNVESVEPLEGSIDQCRNPLISATFNQPMDTASFSGNVIVLGDFGTGACPAGTTYLTAGKYLKLGRLARFWLRVKSVFVEDAIAQATNFCAITGLVSGYQDADSNGVLTFSPSQVLDAGRTYTVIIKGDDLTTASVEGVRNSSGVGMNGPDNETYNGIPFSGRIWSFTTMEETTDNDGICRLEYVRIEPTSYVFTTMDNDTSDDASLTDNSEQPDVDYIFNATAHSSAGAEIVPVAGYGWNWEWLSENGLAARIVASTSAGVTPSAALVRAQNQKDAKTYIKASAKIDVDLINEPPTKGKTKSAKARVYVFICENPWPPVIDPTDWPWYDRSGNCDIDAASCGSNNFEFSYCRDAGTKGTANDLPAITRDPAIRGSSTAPNNLLKEFFFTRAPLPEVTVLTVDDQLTGGRVLAGWDPIPGAGGYKLYYGNAVGSYQTVREVNTSVCAPGCQLFIDDLTNNRRYFFAVTAFYTNDRAESAYSNEVVETPTDKWPPALPIGLTPTPAVGAVDLSWSTTVSSDLAGYRVYYGTADGVYGANVDAEKADAITITGLTSGVTYWFMLGAYDQYNNEATTTAASAIPL